MAGLATGCWTLAGPTRLCWRFRLRLLWACS